MSDDNQRESVLSLQLMCPRDRIQVISFSTKLPHNLSHLARQMYFLLRSWIMPAPKHIWISINGLWLYLLKRKLQCYYPRFLSRWEHPTGLSSIVLSKSTLSRKDSEARCWSARPGVQGRESTQLTPCSPAYISTNNTLSSSTSNKQASKKNLLK